MLEIVMPTSFETSLLDRLQDLNRRYADRSMRVSELYGSLPRSRWGSGRPERSLPAVDEGSIRRHVEAAARRGFRFNYLLNTSCTGNREFDVATRSRMLDELLWVRDIGCSAIVVASPYLLDLAHRHAPELRIHVSSVAFPKSTKEARHYLRRGAARLVLDPDTIRDFAFLRRLRRECPELELEALCNHPCLLNCPYETYCYNSVAHASTSEEEGTYEAYSLLSCNLDKLEDPAEFVKGSWFRPQDAHHYEDVGVAAIKIAGRGRPTDWLVQAAEAYLSREYDGDLMDLVWEAQWRAVSRSTGAAGAVAPPVAVRAADFDGFLEHFVEHAPDCSRGCGSCRHCERFAARAVIADAEALSGSREALRDALTDLLEIPGPGSPRG